MQLDLGLEALRGVALDVKAIEVGQEVRRRPLREQQQQGGGVRASRQIALAVGVGHGRTETTDSSPYCSLSRWTQTFFSSEHIFGGCVSESGLCDDRGEARGQGFGTRAREGEGDAARERRVAQRSRARRTGSSSPWTCRSKPVASAASCTVLTRTRSTRAVCGSSRTSQCLRRAVDGGLHAGGGAPASSRGPPAWRAATPAAGRRAPARCPAG